jgi:imidazolonepropionase-like amidohydrolase
MSQVAATPEDGRQAVRDAYGAGYGFIKVYSKLDLPTFSAIVEEARKLKMRVVGHIPQREQGITDKFFQPGFDLVAHAEEFAQQTATPDDSAIPQYVEMAKRNGTSLIATLTLDDRLVEEVVHPETLKSRAELKTLPPAWYHVVTSQNPYVAGADAKWIAAVQRIVAFNRKLAKAFDDAGIAVMAGTDAPVPGLAPGFALHDELEALVQAGLSNRRALEGATRLAAEWLRVDGDRGTVAVGKRADLLLLDADPLASITNTRRISAVIRDGRYFSRADLDARMADLIKRNSAFP